MYIALVTVCDLWAPSHVIRAFTPKDCVSRARLSIVNLRFLQPDYIAISYNHLIIHQKEVSLLVYKLEIPFGFGDGAISKATPNLR